MEGGLSSHSVGALGGAELGALDLERTGTMPVETHGLGRHRGDAR